MTGHRLRAGFGYGVVATIAMSVLVLLKLVYLLTNPSSTAKNLYLSKLTIK